MKWFKHDADANRDDKLEKVLMKYGAEGYALYWLCLELIASPIDKHNINFELKHDAEILAYRLKMDSAKVEEIMRYFVSQKLFECDSSTGTITCLKLARRIENSIVKNPQLSEIQRLIESRTIPDNPGQPEKPPENSGKPRLDTDRDTDVDVDTDKKRNKGRFTPPSLEAVTSYCRERGNQVDPEAFIDFYESKGWYVGKNKMKDWKAAVRTWEKKRGNGNGQVERQGKSTAYDRTMSAIDEWERSQGASVIDGESVAKDD